MHARAVRACSMKVQRSAQLGAVQVPPAPWKAEQTSISSSPLDLNLTAECLPPQALVRVEGSCIRKGQQSVCTDEDMLCSLTPSALSAAKRCHQINCTHSLIRPHSRLSQPSSTAPHTTDTKVATSHMPPYLTRQITGPTPQHLLTATPHTLTHTRSHRPPRPYYHPNTKPRNQHPRTLSPGCHRPRLPTAVHPGYLPPEPQAPVRRLSSP